MEESENCSICRNKIDMTKSVYTTCGHRFCSDCFFNWMKQKTDCPNCRKKFVSTNEDAHQELENIILATRDWERYMDQLKEDIDIMEERLSYVCDDVLKKESGVAIAKTQLQSIMKEKNKQEEQNAKARQTYHEIRKKGEAQHEYFRRTELMWRERQQKRAEYIREWKELHSRKSNFTMRF
jgi:hypothetical protein